ncbi:MAG: phage head closure protein [Liquorilactobacillus sp.]|uniref:phage head closure protein n=1 Tax=Liquorilactobacillus nagelii TaxID=82688 RepID=UPI0039E9B61E
MTQQLLKTNYQPYQFKKKAIFGTTSSVENSAGVNVPTFVGQFALHYATIKNTIDQKYQALGTKYENTLIIAVKHDSRVNDSLECQLDGITHEIVDVSSDDSMYLSYDLITIKKTKKVGVS